MSRRFINFLSSIGVMVLGVVLLFVGSVKFTAVAGPPRPPLPLSGPRIIAVNGGDKSAGVFPASRPKTPLPRAALTFAGAVNVTAALVVEDETNAVLFKKNSDLTRPLASITKLMSALVLSELPLNWEATTTVAESDTDGSSRQLLSGEVFTLDELWHAALVGSSNSAIHALVRASGFTPREFVERMNRRAQASHLPTIHFVEPTGLSSENVASAWDTARLLKIALDQEKIYRALQLGEYYLRPAGAVKPRRLWNTNWLLTRWVPHDFVPGETVGKTGYIAEAGYNFAVRLVSDQGRAVRVVVLGAASNEERFSVARDLAAWAFTNYTWPDEEGYAALAE